MIMKFADRYAVKLAFWLLFAGFACVLILRIILAWSYIPETGGVSVNVLFGIVRMLSGHSLYTDPSLPPFPVIQYMPLHYYVVAGLSQILHVDTDVHLISVVNRSMCLLFDLLLFIPVQRILWHIFMIRNRKICWTVCFAIFLILPNTNYGRVDNLYLLSFGFAIYYFLCFLSLFENKYGAEIVFSGVFAALAFFTKQSGIFVLGGMFLFLLIYVKDRKALLYFFVSSTVACLVLFVILIGSNYSNWFLNAYKGLQNGINLGWFQEVFVENFFRRMYLFLAGGLALAVISCSTDRDRRERFLGFTALIIFVAALASSFKWGSSTNYFTEFLVLSLILAAVYLRHYSVLHPVAKLFFLFLTPFFIMNVYNDKGWSFLKKLDESEKVHLEAKAAAAYVTANVKNDEYIFTAFHRENLMNLLIGERALFPNREIVFYCTYPMKVFNYEKFSSMYAEGKIKYLVGQDNIKPDMFLDVTFNDFEKVTSFGKFDVYIYIMQ